MQLYRMFTIQLIMVFLFFYIPITAIVFHIYEFAALKVSFKLLKELMKCLDTELRSRLHLYNVLALSNSMDYQFVAFSKDS